MFLNFDYLISNGDAYWLLFFDYGICKLAEPGITGCFICIMPTNELIICVACVANSYIGIITAIVCTSASLFIHHLT